MLIYEDIGYLREKKLTRKSMLFWVQTSATKDASAHVCGPMVACTF